MAEIQNSQPDLGLQQNEEKKQPWISLSFPAAALR
jgi:hypothetical protein